MIDVWMIRAHLIQGSLFPGNHLYPYSFAAANNCAAAMKLSLSFAPFPLSLWWWCLFPHACALSCFLHSIRCSWCSIFQVSRLAWTRSSQEWLLALELLCSNCLPCCSNRDIIGSFGCKLIWWIKMMILNDSLLFGSFKGLTRFFDRLWQYSALRIWPNLLISK